MPRSLLNEIQELHIHHVQTEDSERDVLDPSTWLRNDLHRQLWRFAKYAVVCCGLIVLLFLWSEVKADRSPKETRQWTVSDY
ncbi:MAG: hypothetical protein KJ626_00440 [Verrucomicrobia bacterium]|nr:hypothetical protein [Verrucomicrobiota bacterium]